MYVYVCMYVCMYVQYMYVCMCVCMCACVCVLVKRRVEQVPDGLVITCSCSPSRRPLTAGLQGQHLKDVHGQDHMKVGKVKYDLTEYVYQVTDKLPQYISFW